ncbi:high-affinity branched-chain amino acid transport ATP-binding protein LivF [mine drainage metagenome]|uniref:High-affinity branched-chain amino acid transport ATP-binding protein LivF n=1 Tax=mine drainage metagenome TaxID=410659 RepID=A0A1J5Q6K2_9ZZZZ
MLLDVKDLCVQYGKIEALRGVSFHVNQGEIVSIIGANGAGKTTTLKTISGLLKPTSGSIHFNGIDVATVAPYARVDLGISQVPEGRGIFPGMTVLENLEMGKYHRKHGRAEMSEDLEKVFELFPRVKERAAQSAGTLSGGEQQMVAIGRALMSRPTLLLLDEPSMGLAPMIVTQIFEIITKINQDGMTVVLVEQNAQQALLRSERAYVMETGTVVKTAPSKDLLNDDAVKRAYLGIGA